jgi:hypothetical protein
MLRSSSRPLELTYEEKQMATTKKDIKSDFAYARLLMRKIDEALKDSKNITDFSESSELGQMGLELMATTGTFLQYLQEQEEAK